MTNVIKAIKRKVNTYRKRYQFARSFKEFEQKYKGNIRYEQLPVNDNYLKPMLLDATDNTKFDSHYVYHTAWAARRLSKDSPKEHVDIGSYHYFSTLVSAFIPITFYDYRPIIINLANLNIGQVDLTKMDFEDSSIYSLSCMHVVEHIGLGRYGDPIDPDGDIKAINELIRVIAPTGYLYFVVPIGNPKICFNAHRIYDPLWIKDLFISNGFYLDEFAVIPDGEGLLRNQSPIHYQDQNYACGCYAFRKA